MSKEQEAKKILDEIGDIVTDGKGMKRYTRLDLVQFARLWEIEQTKGRKIYEVANDYVAVMERTSAAQKLENLKNAINLIFDEEE